VSRPQASAISSSSSEPFHSKSGFEDAPQAHILRALQKDQYYISGLHQRIEDLAANALHRRAYGMEEELRMLTYCCYFGLTTLIGKQTLGEEYCDIMQVDGFRRHPSKFRRVCLVAIQCLAPYLFRRLASDFRTVPDADDEEEENAPDQGILLAAYRNIITGIRALYPYLDSIRDLHTALFYLFGRYLEVSKTLCGVQYLYLQRARGQVGYQVLGLLLGIQLTGSLLIMTAGRLRAMASSSSEEEARQELLKTSTGFSDGEEDNAEDTNFDEKSHPKCVFCFERRKNTTATECGHLFCWGCILTCCDRKAECPLCRQPIQRQTLIRLEHYAPAPETQGDEEDVDEEVSD